MEITNAMKKNTLGLMLLALVASPVWAEDADQMSQDDHLMGTVSAVEDGQIKVQTEKGEKTVMTPQASEHRMMGHERMALKKGEKVTIHGEMMKDGKFTAHEIYRGQCGDKMKCADKDLAWSHMHKMMEEGQHMGHGMMEKHKSGHGMN